MGGGRGMVLFYPGFYPRLGAKDLNFISLFGSLPLGPVKPLWRVVLRLSHPIHTTHSSEQEAMPAFKKNGVGDPLYPKQSSFSSSSSLR